MQDATGAIDTPIPQPIASPVAAPADEPFNAVGLGAAAMASAALAACGGGGGGTSQSEPTPVIAGTRISLSTSGYTQLSPITDALASRFLQQAQFSASETEIAAVRSLGFARWLETEVAKPSGIMGWDWLNAQGYGNVNSPSNYYDSSTPGDYMAWSQLMAAPDAARKRMALALSEIMVVSLSGLDFSWRSHAIAKYWDTLNTHAFGNYRDLLGAITLNVAMGYYLNTKGNRKEDTSTGRQPDENYAREVMQLFTLGLTKLNPDGTPQSGSPDTYTASDVSNLARVLTGYDIDQTQNVPTAIAQTGGGTRTVPSTDYVRLPLKLTTNTTNNSTANHSTSDASFLGVTIAGSTNPTVALNTALDTLFAHPNIAPFVCKQLIQRLVTSNPSAAYVGRVAATFANNGSGVRGDLAYVYAAILLDDEARNPANADPLQAPEFGRLREPMVRLVQWARTFGVSSAAGTWKVGDLSNPGTQLGQSPLRSPSVFNFFRPGYVPPGTSLTGGRVAPEFQLVNESSVGGYLNYLMNSVIDRGINGNSDMKAAYTAELALAASNPPTALVARLNLLLCAGQLSSSTAATITTAVGNMAGTVSNTTTTATNLRNRVCAAVLMVMASADYLIQK